MSSSLPSINSKSRREVSVKSGSFVAPLFGMFRKLDSENVLGIE